MRFLIAIVINLALWSAALAADRDVGQLVDAAVNALRTQSYEARVHFFGSTDDGGEQIVHIFHVAPELYHVRVMKLDHHGRLEETGVRYIENGVEQVMVVLDGADIIAVEKMPQRTFYTRDALTIKFLRDLASHPGTVVLNGMVGSDADGEGQPVYVLRQTKQPEKPYTITVGLDKECYFPLFLLVTNDNDAQRIYYEIEIIQYSETSDMDASLFVVPEKDSSKNFNQIGSNQLSPDSVVLQSSESTGDQAKVSLRRPSSAKAAPEYEEEVYNLPLYPKWLPDGYSVEGLRLLDYPTEVDGQRSTKLVYQFEILGPSESSALSIFQVQAGDLEFKADSIDATPDCGYLIRERDNWLVTVVGGLGPEVLEEIVDGLIVSDAKVADLLEMTRRQDLVQREVVADE